MRASEGIVHTHSHTVIYQEYRMGINVVVNVHMDQIKVLHTRTKTPRWVVLMHAKPFHGIHVTAPTLMDVWEPIVCIQIRTFLEQYEPQYMFTPRFILVDKILNEMFFSLIFFFSINLHIAIMFEDIQGVRKVI
jgi:hypothetical protein